MALVRKPGCSAGANLFILLLLLLLLLSFCAGSVCKVFVFLMFVTGGAANGLIGGNGGVGLSVSITGTAVFYAGFVMP